VISDSGVIAGALQSGEVDWWDYALVDVLPQLKRDPGVRVEVLEPTGQIPIIRVNQLTPPFDNQGVRQALLAAIQQSEFMRGLGGDASLWHAPVGVFCPGTPMASDVGLEMFTGPRNWSAVKAALDKAGYGGEKVAFLAATDSPQIQTLCEIGADAMRQGGFTVDYQSMDWGTVLQRRAKKDPIDHGGWSAFVTNGWQGTDMLDPISNISLRGNGANAWVGWPTAPKLEALRRDWMAEPSVDGQKRIAAEMQAQAWIDVPYVPLGQNLQPSAFRADLDGVLKGFPVFWNVRRVS
jgi:peptide/nickel transport system substrate-binding protein